MIWSLAATVHLSEPEVTAGKAHYAHRNCVHKAVDALVLTKISSDKSADCALVKCRKFEPAANAEIAKVAGFRPNAIAFRGKSMLVPDTRYWIEKRVAAARTER